MSYVRLRNDVAMPPHPLGPLWMLIKANTSTQGQHQYNVRAMETRSRKTMVYSVIKLLMAAMLAFASVDHVFADTINKTDNAKISWPAIEELLDLTKDLGNITSQFQFNVT